MTTRKTSNRSCRGPVTVLLVLLLLGMTGACTTTDPSEKLPVDRTDWKNINFGGLFSDRPRLDDSDLPYPWKKEMDFLSDLSGKRIATMGDAVMSFTLIAGMSPWGKNFDELVAPLVEREIMHEEWVLDETKPLTLGKISYMICQACRIRGGVWLQLFGPSERYCFKEVMYLEIIPPGSTHRFLSGEQLLDVLAAGLLYYREKVAG